jgi:Protein of unknown function (DUF3800)
MLSLISYLDESGSHKDAIVRTLGGFIGTELEWIRFDEEWKKVLDKPCWPKRPKELHMYDCVFGINDFAGWRFAERLTLVGDLVGVLEGFSDCIFGISAGAISNIFSNISTEDSQLLQAEHLGTTEELSLQLCIQQLSHWTSQIWPSEPIGVVFDEDSQDVKIFRRQHLLYYAVSGMLNLYAIGFGDSVQFTPLQAADLLAYGTYQRAMKDLCPEFSEPYFPSIPVFNRLIEHVGGERAIYNDSALQGLLKQVRERHGRL